MLGEVVCHSILQTRVVNSDLSSVTGQVEVEQVTSFKKRSGRSYEQVVLKLRSQCTTVYEAHATGSHLPLPTEGGVAVFCTRKHEQTRQSICRSVGDVGGRPAQLLQSLSSERCFDLLELGDAVYGPLDLDPAAIQTRLHTIKLAK